MNTEIETKVLDIKVDLLKQKLDQLGARMLGSNRLVVDWFWEPGTVLGQEPWFLRVRSYSGGTVEITWKERSKVLGTARQHGEINLNVNDHQKTCDFFTAIGLVDYAHQEKDRTSWELFDVRLDLDQYPGMPAYLEIEGPSEEFIYKAITELGLQNHKTSSEGERKLITNEYGLDWFNMRFSK